MLLLALIALASLTVLIATVVYARWNYGVLEALNIPVADRSFLLGSTGDMHRRIQHFADMERFEKLGRPKLFGVYEGRYPHVHVCDPELIKQIFVKDTHHFQDRRVVDLGHAIVNEMMDFLPYQKWKVVRQALTPAFTTGKLKLAMTDHVYSGVKEFVEHLKKQAKASGPNGSRIDCQKTFMPFLIDLTSRGIFGMRLDDPFNSENEFTRAFKEMQHEDAAKPLMFSLAFSFPLLTALAPLMSPRAVKFISTFFLRATSSTDSGTDNFLQRLKEMMGKLHTEEYRRLNISEHTIIAQAFNAFVAGYEGMGTTLTFLFYYLATNDDIREKLQYEVDAVEEEGLELNYENVSKLEYLQACVKETLRLVPPFIRSERICTEDWTYNEIRIKKGCVVILPSWPANRNSSIYENPDNFYPDRFLDENLAKKENYQYAFTTFGFGPRNCIGLKFAMDALKLTVAHLVRNFEFKCCFDTRIEFKPGEPFFLKYYPVYMNMYLRGL